MEHPDGEFHRAAQRRAEAEKALIDWTTQQRLVRAQNSRTKPAADYRPGELVYFWRSQTGQQGRRQPGNRHGAFLGPARILATETRLESSGQARPSNAVWCARGRSLLKCSPEQLRRASPREEVLDTLAQGAQATPWTYTRAAEEIGGNQYQDITGDLPTLQEWQRAQDIEQEEPPLRFRLRRKRPEPEPWDVDMPEEDSEAQPSAPSRPARPQGPGAHWTEKEGTNWWQDIDETAFATEEACFWNTEGAAVAVEVEMPSTEKGWTQACRDLRGYFVGALKRRAAEVHEKHLSPEERQEFAAAKSVEVRNFVASGAFQALPDHLVLSRDQAIGMRWILTWKMKDDGSHKAKARAVLLGYQDPVMSRQSRQHLAADPTSLQVGRLG